MSSIQKGVQFYKINCPIPPLFHKYSTEFVDKCLPKSIFLCLAPLYMIQAPAYTIFFVAETQEADCLSVDDPDLS